MLCSSRVGRGAAPVNEELESAFCILLFTPNFGLLKDNAYAEIEQDACQDSDTGNASEYVLTSSRLKFLETCSDGFEISQFDMELRGAGDLFGLRQHGLGGLR